jgi:hypothetical protein
MWRIMISLYPRICIYHRSRPMNPVWTFPTRNSAYVDFCRMQSLSPMILVVYHKILCLERIWNIETPLHPNSYIQREILGRAVVFMIFIHTGIPEVTIIILEPQVILMYPIIGESPVTADGLTAPGGRPRAKTACHFFFGGGSQRVIVGTPSSGQSRKSAKASVR